MKSWSRQQLEAEQKTKRQSRHREIRFIGKSRYLLGPEDAIQFDFFQFVAMHETRFPQLQRIFAIPNGSHKSKTQRAVMQVTGLKPGVPDVLVSVPAQGYAGFYIEFKAGRNKLTPEQETWRELLTAIGYRFDVHRSWITAANEVIGYLKLPLQSIV